MQERLLRYSVPVCITVADTVFKYVFLQIISFLPFPPYQTNSPDLGLCTWKCSFSVDKQILTGNMMAKLKSPQWGKECNLIDLPSYSNKISFHADNICCK